MTYTINFQGHEQASIEDVSESVACGIVAAYLTAYPLAGSRENASQLARVNDAGGDIIGRYELPDGAIIVTGDRHTMLTRSIVTESDVFAFYQFLNNNDLIYHPDDDANDCLRNEGLDPSDIVNIQERVNEAFNVEYSTPEVQCPSGVALTFIDI